MLTLLRWISDALWPPACVGCLTAGPMLCRRCCDALPPAPPPGRIGSCTLIAAGTLRSRVLERAVWHLKYRNAVEIAGPLGDLMAAAVGRACVAADIVIPIPLHRRRLRERGYNQALLLASRIASVAALPCAELLVRQRNTASQVRARSRQERALNIRGAFTVPRPQDVRGKRVLLVDDVGTTGATLSAAAAALTDAGAVRVVAAVVARG